MSEHPISICDSTAMMGTSYEHATSASEPKRIKSTATIQSEIKQTLLATTSNIFSIETITSSDPFIQELRQKYHVEDNSKFEILVRGAITDILHGSISDTCDDACETEEVDNVQGISKELCSFLSSCTGCTDHDTITALPKQKVIKCIWKYIKQNNLQNPNQGDLIILDNQLRHALKIVQTTEIHIMELFSLVSSIYANRTIDIDIDIEGNQNSSKKRKHLQNENIYFNYSNALSKLMNTQRAMTRNRIMKNVWNYIQRHNLQNPLDKKEITLDEKISELTNGYCTTVTMFELSTFINEHILSKAELDNDLSDIDNNVDGDDDDESVVSSVLVQINNETTATNSKKVKYLSLPDEASSSKKVEILSISESEVSSKEGESAQSENDDDFSY